MKIREIVLENEEWIKTYWTLRSISIDSLVKTFTSIMSTFSVNPQYAKSDLLQLSSYLLELLSDPNWQYLEDDPDYEKVYNELLDLLDEIKEILQHK